MVHFLLEGKSHNSVLSNASCPVSAIKNSTIGFNMSFYFYFFPHFFTEIADRLALYLL